MWWEQLWHLKDPREVPAKGRCGPELPEFPGENWEPISIKLEWEGKMRIES